jgi:purine-nucleoside phosphorylase
MSTVIEASRARELGMRVAGLSCITNKATGTSTEKLSHEEVTVVANRVRTMFASLVTGLLTHLP